MTLLQHAVGALLRSGVIGEVVVAVPPALVPQAGELLSDGRLPDPGSEAVRVVAIRENGHGHRVRAVLRLLGPVDGRPVVVHDPLYPLAPATLVRAVLEELLRTGARPRAGAVALPVRPVTDTLKWVDEDGVVRGTADRNRFRMVSSPQAFHREELLMTLERAGDDQLRGAGAEVLPRLVQAGGGRLLPVPATGEMFPLSTAADLLLAAVAPGADQGIRN